MPREDKSVIARISVKGEHFEVMVDPDLAWDLKNGKQVDFKALLISETVYKEARKGTKATDESLQKNFGTTDLKAIVEAILRKGELQLTTEQRREMVENKRKQIVAFIARNCIDPKTSTPHPPQRIENAMENIRINIDPFRSTEEQAQEIIKELRVSLPLKISQVSITVKSPKEHASSVSSYVTKSGNIIKSNWLADGSWLGESVIPAGMQQSFIDRLNDMTRGNVEINVKKL
ncbi:MAG: ribosome assembly factor SBDS [Candidatus Methanomethylicaceae archaeon]|jgi:ribosome maturation protein SDO1